VELVPQQLVVRRPPGLVGQLSFGQTAGAPLTAEFAGDAPGDAVQPAADGSPPANGGGPAGQHEERGLEGVLGVVRVGHQAAAHAQHHRPVPLHEQGERRLLAAVAEPLEQLPVRQVAPGLRVGPLAQAAEELAQRPGLHGQDSPVVGWSPPHSAAREPV
jgi:hypothetical protein